MKKLLSVFMLCAIMLVGCANGSSVQNISKNLNSYNLQIQYNPNHTLNIKQQFNYKNSTGNTLNELRFALYPTAFSNGAENTPVSPTNIKKAYPNGMSYGGIEINKLMVDGTDVNPKYDGTDDYILVVELPSELKNNKNVTVNFEFVVTLPNVNHRFGYGNNTINVANFYPVIGIYEENGFNCTPYHYNGDPFYSDVANYNVTLTAPSNLTLATTGEIKNEKQVGDNKEYEISALAVRDYAFVLSDKFTKESTKTGTTEINYFYYKDDNPAKSLETAKRAVETFNEMFGKYPYNVLNVVETNFVHGGMEFPNLVYISDEVANYNDYLNVIIHEIAHQWWYGVVGSNAYEYGWLDEGLTEFSTVMFYEKNADFGIISNDIIKNSTNSYVMFVELMEDVIGNANTSMNRNLSEYDTESEYVYMTYIKGMLFYNNLRDIVGADNFNKALKEYFKNYSFKIATPENLIETFKQVTKYDLESVVNSWLKGQVVIKNVA